MTVSSRRRFMQMASAVSLGFLGLRNYLLAGESKSAESAGRMGFSPPVPDPWGLINLPKGFRYRVISKQGERMSDGFLVPRLHDGMAAFPGPGDKVILVRNHEANNHPARDGPFGWNNELFPQVDRADVFDAGFGKKPVLGGTTTVVYDPGSGAVESHFLSLAGTARNCAGGLTPWNSWISCEESVQSADEQYELDHGFNFEVPATTKIGLADPRPLEAMGRFNHEAVAVDPRTGIVYQTEDRSDGLLYRFIPNEPGRLAKGGRLEALMIVQRPGLDMRNWPGAEELPHTPAVLVGQGLDVTWVSIENVLSPKDDLRQQGYSKGAAVFARGEGAWYGRESIYFACTSGGPKHAGQIWRYVPSPFEATGNEKRVPGRLELFLESQDETVLENADNLTVAPWGDVIVCEDGPGQDRIIGITPEGQAYLIGENAISDAEFAGLCFAPDGRTLFVNIQQAGITLAITGPWMAS